MSAVRNTVLTVVATATLVAGLLVLIPAASAAIQPQAPVVSLTDRDTGTANTLRTTLSVQVLIPAGEFIPIGYASVIRSSGTPSFTSGTLNGSVCSATITGVAGASPTYGRFSGYGYSDITANGYGYGYSFSGSQVSVDFSGYNAGYALGYGYGYGYSTTSTIVTVTIVADDCPQVGDFTGTFTSFNFQAFIGSDPTRTFRSLPVTSVNLRNPEVAFANNPDTTATSGNFVPSVQSGLTTTFGFLAQVGALDGSDDLTGTGINLPLAAGTFGSSLTLNINPAQPLPEGATLQLSFLDRDTGGSFTATSGAFNIDGNVLSTLTGGIAPAGFFSVTCTGCDPSVPLTTYIDLVLVLDVPQSYFTGPPALNPGLFRLMRFSDAGTRSASDPSCTWLGSVNSNADYRYSCTLTDFSAFALVASASFGGGGGGGGSSSTATPTSATSTVTVSTGTSPATGTSAPTSGAAPVPTGTTGGSQGGDGGDGGDGESSGGKKKTGIPGFEGLAALAAIGLAAAAVAVSRRNLK